MSHIPGQSKLMKNGGAGLPPGFSVDRRGFFADPYHCRTPACDSPPTRLSRPNGVPMLDLRTGSASDCTGVSRRTFLRVGGLAAFGLTLPNYLRARAAADPGGSRPPLAKRCILLWMQGGP